MNSKRVFLYQAVLALVPLVYLAFVWRSLPARVPTHYDIDLTVDAYGAKTEVLYLMIFLYVLTLLTSLLVLKIHRLDPKLREAGPTRAHVNISWVVIFVLTLLGLSIVADIVAKSGHPPKSFLSFKLLNMLVALLFCLIGNYIQHIKPNYTLGIRTPWTLDDPEIWRKTHLLGAKFTFWTGLVMLILVLVLPTLIGTVILLTGVLLIILVPVVYSYNLFHSLHGENSH